MLLLFCLTRRPLNRNPKILEPPLVSRHSVCLSYTSHLNNKHYIKQSSPSLYTEFFPSFCTIGLKSASNGLLIAYRPIVHSVSPAFWIANFYGVIKRASSLTTKYKLNQANWEARKSGNLAWNLLRWFGWVSMILLRNRLIVKTDWRSDSHWPNRM